MALKCIFVNKRTWEGLYAFEDDGELLNEYHRVFSNWNNVQYVTNYCLKNEDYLKADFFKNRKTDDIIDQILDEAVKLENDIEEHAKAGIKGGMKNLDILFKPLTNKESPFRDLQKMKASFRQFKSFIKPILRVYAIRLSANTFVITGGAIKLTEFMKDHRDTKDELLKIARVRDRLKDDGISVPDDLNFYFYES